MKDDKEVPAMTCAPLVFLYPSLSVPNSTSEWGILIFFPSGEHMHRFIFPILAKNEG